MRSSAKRICRYIVTAAMMLSAASVLGQSYPSKPIRLIVPFPPGGTTDIVARIVLSQVQPHLGQHLVVDNRPGAGGVVGAEMLARANPDGYTLGVATVSTIATAPNMAVSTIATAPNKAPRVRYDPMKDFTAIINMAATPNVLVVHPSFPARTYKEFMDELRRRPDGHYLYASSGEGGLGHALMLLFQLSTKTSLLHVPHKGGGPAVNSLVSGQVSVMIANLPTILPHIQAKRLVPLAVAGTEQVATMLKAPTFAELGAPEVNRLAFYGLCGPRGVSRQIVHRVHAAVSRTLSDPRVKARIENTGSIVIANSPDEFQDQIRMEFEIYKRAFQTQKINR